MKNWRKLTIALALLMVCLCAAVLPVSVSAESIRLSHSSSTSGRGNAVKIRKVSYDPAEKYEPAKLEIDFSHRITWKRSARIVSVKDQNGTVYEAYLQDKDSDECDVAIDNLKEGRTYTVIIDGIKKSGTKGFRKLTLKAKIPAADKNQKVKVRKVQVDDDNDDFDKYQTEIDIKFTSKVVWKRGAKVVSVKDSQGKSYQGRLTDIDNDECEVYIKNLKHHKTYTIRISGIEARGASSYETISVKVTVPRLSHALRVKEAEYDIDYDDSDYFQDGITAFSVEFSFNKNAAYRRNSYIIVKDTSGKKYSTRNSYVEWDGDDCQVYLSKELEYGKVYQYEIVNVKAIGETSYTTLKGTFIAR